MHGSKWQILASDLDAYLEWINFNWILPLAAPFVKEGF